MDVTADVLGRRQTVEALQRRVDHHVPQVAVQDGQTDRGLGHQLHRQRQIPFHLSQGGLIGRDAQGVRHSLLAQQPHVAELHQPRTAVLVPHGKHAYPGFTTAHHLREQVQDEVEVLRSHQQGGREPAQRLVRGPAEQLLGLRTPQRDPTRAVQYHRGHTQHVQQPTRLGRGDPHRGRTLRERTGGTHEAPLLPKYIAVPDSVAPSPGIVFHPLSRRYRPQPEALADGRRRECSTRSSPAGGWECGRVAAIRLGQGASTPIGGPGARRPVPTPGEALRSLRGAAPRLEKAGNLRRTALDPPSRLTPRRGRGTNGSDRGLIGAVPAVDRRNRYGPSPWRVSLIPPESDSLHPARAIPLDAIWRQDREILESPVDSKAR